LNGGRAWIPGFAENIRESGIELAAHGKSSNIQIRIRIFYLNKQDCRVKENALGIFLVEETLA